MCHKTIRRMPNLEELNQKNTSKRLFEQSIKRYLEQARRKLLHELEGTRGAIKLLAKDKVQDFIRVSDIGFDKEEIKMLNDMVVSSMYQSFCYGYGIGKMEGVTNKKIIL